MQDTEEVADSKGKTEKKEPRYARLRTGLLVVGSALLGGIAVVLWNRRGLTDIQNQAKENVPRPRPMDDDAIY